MVVGHGREANRRPAVLRLARGLCRSLSGYGLEPLSLGHVDRGAEPFPLLRRTLSLALSLPWAENLPLLRWRGFLCLALTLRWAETLPLLRCAGFSKFGPYLGLGRDVAWARGLARVGPYRRGTKICPSALGARSM